MRSGELTGYSTRALTLKTAALQPSFQGLFHAGCMRRALPRSLCESMTARGLALDGLSFGGVSLRAEPFDLRKDAARGASAVRRAEAFEQPCLFPTRKWFSSRQMKSPVTLMVLLPACSSRFPVGLVTIESNRSHPAAGIRGTAQGPCRPHPCQQHIETQSYTFLNIDNPVHVQLFLSMRLGTR